MNAVARAQLTYQMLTLLQKQIPYLHYGDVTWAYQITSNSTVWWTACSDQQKKETSKHYCPFVKGIHWRTVDSPRNGPLMRSLRAMKRTPLCLGYIPGNVPIESPSPNFETVVTESSMPWRITHPQDFPPSSSIAHWWLVDGIKVLLKKKCFRNGDNQMSICMFVRVRVRACVQFRSIA